MNLKSLNRTELDLRIKTLVEQERELLHEIILTIKEIDQRRLYLDLGYPSLFAYLVGSVGYSAGSAQRRIDAARLLKEVPELGERIQAGNLNLAQVALIQKASREVYRQTLVKVSREEKLDLLNRVSHKNFQETQKEINQFFEVPVLTEQKQEVQADESVRIELTLSKELYEKIKYAQSLVSHAVPSTELAAFLEYVADRVIKQKTGAKPEAKAKASEAKSTATVAVKTSSSNFSQATKKQILHLQQNCQHREPFTNKQCGSRWFLQIDHKQSRWAGGSSELGNAQVLCAQHNQAKYRKEVGVKVPLQK